MSKSAERYKLFYEKGFWTKKMLRNVVDKSVGGITAEEYEQITGEPYSV